MAYALLRQAVDEERLRAHLIQVGAIPAATTLRQRLRDAGVMSRSTIARILTEADLKPHRSVYWLNSHDPNFDAIAQHLGQLYRDAPRLWQQEGELVVSTDEKTGMLIRQRRHATLPSRPGQPRRREHEYIRHGSRHVTATLCVPTGQVAYTLTTSHNGLDFAAHLRQAVAELPQATRYHWVLDNNRTHSCPVVCQTVAELCALPPDAAKLQTAPQRRAFLSDASHRHVFHFTPVHGSWLNQVEMWFGTLTRRLLRRDDFASASDFVARFAAWLAEYNGVWAHPYAWTYAGTPLVRDTPFDRTRRQAQRGRAGLSRRRRCFERLFYPPRPYHRAVPA